MSFAVYVTTKSTKCCFGYDRHVYMRAELNLKIIGSNKRCLIQFFGMIKLKLAPFEKRRIFDL
ncbi:MAG: hypothetical protein Hyperionvirus36_4 [Hyperionvirus sp.]|uniref:Uncharacterized protein n=1 Tax=Hyperionvirus sp. TaxID=2487770 RepID=A0A3G5AC33_9VIRU|nr:MAG: hypothetical protein Hyperionvirus36_4 [Hyperionvirus sp.]